MHDSNFSEIPEDLAGQDEFPEIPEDPGQAEFPESAPKPYQIRNSTDQTYHINRIRNQNFRSYRIRIIIAYRIVTERLKLRGVAASTTKEEVVAILKDAVDVVKSFFGAPNFDAAVIVIPNNTSEKYQDDIISYGRGNGFNITQVIKEHTAVSAVYVKKVQPKISTNLAIISLTGGILEISVVSIVPPINQYEHYHFVLEAHEAHPEVIDLDGSKDQKGSRSGIIGIIGGTAKALVVDPFENILAGILKNIVEILNIKKTEVDKVVFVGKASRSEKVRKAVKESFSKAEVWEGIDNPDEIVAYGAAYLSYEDKKIPIYPLNTPKIPEDQGQAEFPLLDPEQAELPVLDPEQAELPESTPGR
ncbi:endoplasmic reticulum chaperone BiP-like [Dendrobium catenatum]|uniref:endoplasmic reticulum chaperone BiP-like n=1 Tax=Dendrobium catenatum TaxID=906689 RepID=UPI00109F87DF|nr:endoplasmic reticulum chaperone BiP-like [Dendrobium catenatum]